MSKENQEKAKLLMSALALAGTIAGDSYYFNSDDDLMKNFVCESAKDRCDHRCDTCAWRKK